MKIGIFTAMQKEAESFLGNDVQESFYGEFHIYLFKIGACDAVLCCPPSIGEIAAASACQALISHFGVDVVLNFGVVGSLTESTSVLSTVFVESVVHYDFDTSAIDGFPVGRYSNFDDIAVSCDKTLLRRACDVVSLPMVRCASADKFVESSSQKALLYRSFDAQICDMESAGILFACKYNHVPCLLVKCVSDSLNNTLNDYETNAIEASKGFFRLAEKIIANL